MDHLIMRFCVDVGHLGKWCRVRITHTSDNVIMQFRDPHTAMIDFRHADECWYSAVSTLLFLGPPLQHYVVMLAVAGSSLTAYNYHKNLAK